MKFMLAMLYSDLVGFELICIIFMPYAAAKFASLNEPCTNSLFCLGDKICNKDNLCVCPENQVPTSDNTCKPLGENSTQGPSTPAPRPVVEPPTFIIIEPTYYEVMPTKNPHFPVKAKPGQLCSFEVSCTGKSRCYKGHCHCLSGYMMSGDECVVKTSVGALTNAYNRNSMWMLSRSRNIYQQVPQQIVPWPALGRQQFFRRWN